MNNTPYLLIHDLTLNQSSVIYVATRLFDIEEKYKAQLLEEAVLEGVRLCAYQNGIEHLNDKVTFVPFRDASQEDMQGENKTKLLYQKDIEVLEKSPLIITYLDGLSKDEGICFELGFAAAKEKPIIIISTDFFSHQIPSQEILPFDPILLPNITEMIRIPQLVKYHNDFTANLLATREKVLSATSKAVTRVLSSPAPVRKSDTSEPRPFADAQEQIFIEFGGEIFEWQTVMAQRLANYLSTKVHVERSTRLQGWWNSDHDAQAEARCELEAITRSSLVITCTDADECPAGTAFIQGYATGMGKEIWMYNSKITNIVAENGYRSSRNLMLDNSASRTFNTFNKLLEALSHRYQIEEQ